MSHHQKFSGFLITFAFLLTFLHAAIPHHHHGDMVCFSLTCTEAHCHTDCHCETHHHNDADCDCACHSHPSHQHDEDNCVLTLPYILPDNSDINTHLNPGFSFQYQYFTYITPTDCELPSPTETAEFALFAPDEGLPDSPGADGFLQRGPPTC